jgi:hypothetical protein
VAVVRPGSFVYLAHPSTGSTATATALLKIEGAFMPLDKRRRWGAHASMEQVMSVCKDQFTGREVVFTGIRNPYDALATWFVLNENHFQMQRREERLKRPLRIKEFLDIWLQMDADVSIGAPPWLRDGRMFYHDDAAREFVRQENLQAELNRLLRKVPESPGHVELHREHVTPDKDHWTSYYSDADYAYVNEKLRDEFVKFGYPFVWSNDAFA